MWKLEETSSGHREEEEEEAGLANRTNALSATRRGTLPGTVTRTKRGPGRDERKKKKKLSSFNENKLFQPNDGQLLDTLEGVAKIQDEYIEEFDDIFLIEPDARNQVVGSIYRHRDAWKKMDSGKMLQNIIEERLRLNFKQGQP